MASRTPPLLESYLALPPEAAQIVLTGVLGASTNWLVLRYLRSLLSAPPPTPALSSAAAPHPSAAGNPGPHPRVVLVSFLRDYAFWRDGAARLGVDLDALGGAGRFGFVDGLSGLSTSGGPGAERVARTGEVTPSWRRVLRSGQVADVRAAVGAAVDGLAVGDEQTPPEDDARVVLVVDQPDFLLAATGAGVRALQDMVLDLREKVHATILVLAADEPLIQLQTTKLEIEHASLVLTLAFEADMVVSLRLLDTGTAKDVTGVMRITQGGSSGVTVEEREYLYHVRGDGGVQVLERGQ